ncbi:putative Mg2+ transporter-C (MgtC) family protein [Paraburkholderia sp. GAS448]|jgi:putative Mg2+ transporter-C (MgtC) family protein
MPMISHVQLLEAILRMVAAVLVGCIVGLDRNLHGKPTGVKTLGLVALGSCLVTMAGMSFELHGFTDGSDAGRAIQGVITGIGFLGAGVILQNRATGRISGLTTAASIWVTAALGIVCGIGAWQIAGIATALLLLLLSVGGSIERALHRRWLRKSPEEQAAAMRHDE